MKKRNLLVVALILLASPLWAGQLQDKLKGVIVSKSAPAGCAGGAAGVLGNNGAITATAGYNDGAASFLILGSFVPSTAGSVAYIHWTQYSTTNKMRGGIWNTSGVLLGATSEITGDNSSNAVHGALASSVCLVADTTYYLGVWLEANDYAGVGAVGAYTEENQPGYILMSSFGNFTPAGLSYGANTRVLGVSANNSSDTR